MAEVSIAPGSENLNVKNGNFICGVVEGKIRFVALQTDTKRKQPEDWICIIVAVVGEWNLP